MRYVLASLGFFLVVFLVIQVTVYLTPCREPEDVEDFFVLLAEKERAGDYELIYDTLTSRALRARFGRDVFTENRRETEKLVGPFLDRFLVDVIPAGQGCRVVTLTVHTMGQSHEEFGLARDLIGRLRIQSIQAQAPHPHLPALPGGPTQDIP